MKTPYALGCKRDFHDHRDCDYEFHKHFPTLITFPKREDIRPKLWPILDQSSCGACTGFGIGDGDRNALRLGGFPDFEPSQLFIYFNERRKEGTVNEDAGAAIRDGIKSVATTGVCEESFWPYDISKFTDTPPQAAYTNAKTLHHHATKYMRVTNGLPGIKTALVAGFIVTVGFTVYENFFDIGANGLMPKPSGGIAGGHCVNIVGYSDVSDEFVVRNQWGVGWGDAGYLYAKYADFMPLLQDIWVIQKVS